MARSVRHFGRFGALLLCVLAYSCTSGRWETVPASRSTTTTLKPTTVTTTPAARVPTAAASTTTTIVIRWPDGSEVVTQSRPTGSQAAITATTLPPATATTLPPTIPVTTLPAVKPATPVSATTTTLRQPVAVPMAAASTTSTLPAAPATQPLSSGARQIDIPELAPGASPWRLSFPASPESVPALVPPNPAVLASRSVPAKAPASGEGKGAFFVTNGVSYVARTEGKAIAVYANGRWEKSFLKGVNIGAGKPGYFPGELAITKEEYLRWFAAIRDMGTDCIRVYTTLMPAFYEALAEFNAASPRPLWLFQGVWISEELMEHSGTAFAQGSALVDEFLKDATDLVDIIHGNKTLPEKRGFASGTYKADVSRWTIGWIMGIEWYPFFVANTDIVHPDRIKYEGRYLRTVGASPFEVFLCEVCDRTVAYEVERYSQMRPMSVNNWPTADPLRHPNESYPQEDICSLDVRHIVATDAFPAGWFASFHIYPYYPDFITHDVRYTRFFDDDATVNTYRAYLRELMSLYSIPVIVAEFGVPASRGMAHIAPYSRYDQGHHTEAEQGRILSHLMRDIWKEGYCGGIAFTWQDEWFKRTWNTMDLDDPAARPYWSNVQTNEQMFGILSFDPGAKTTVCTVDGTIAEWRNDPPLAAGTGIRIHTRSDERYLYLMASVAGYRFGRDRLVFALDTIPDQGNSRALSLPLQFSKPADFLVVIHRQDNSRILVDAYYDAFHYLYGIQEPFLPVDPAWAVKDSGIFNPILLALNRSQTLPATKVKIPFSSYETGALRFGNADPASPAYDSLADFCASGEEVEIRIPWLLLNVMNPARATVMADLYATKGISRRESTTWNIGAGVLKEGSQNAVRIGMRPWNLPRWDMPLYHERLKDSYYILRDAFTVLDQEDR